jgi:hypothetical protein
MTMDNENNKMVLQNLNKETGDCNKISISKVLSQRLKKYKPTLAKIFPFLVVGFICFAAGVGVNRNLTKHRFDRTLNGKISIQRNIPDSQSSATQAKGTNRLPQHRQIQ